MSNSTVYKWRTEKKGETIVRDGTTYYWCPKHVHPAGHYSGLYYRDHKAAGDEWKKTRHWNKPNQKTAATTDASGSGAPSNGNPANKKLTIANELKTAFASNLCVSEEDIDKIIAKVNSSAQGN